VKLKDVIDEQQQLEWDTDIKKKVGSQVYVTPMMPLAMMNSPAMASSVMLLSVILHLTGKSA
jgi:hypothetical protein